VIKNKIVLIAGGNGLTGSELAKKIIDYEAKVFVVDKNKKITNNFKKYSKIEILLVWLKILVK
jgi:FlaA1/EpsC-like NDP-sugar epimerase|tara:strand:+ start:186 stop:374 length:189 start_codon:yes stop_codon:yes gene_type:complete